MQKIKSEISQNLYNYTSSNLHNSLNIIKHIENDDLFPKYCSLIQILKYLIF